MIATARGGVTIDQMTPADVTTAGELLWNAGHQFVVGVTRDRICIGSALPKDGCTCCVTDGQMHWPRQADGCGVRVGLANHCRSDCLGAKKTDLRISGWMLFSRVTAILQPKKSVL